MRIAQDPLVNLLYHASKERERKRESEKNSRKLDRVPDKRLIRPPTAIEIPPFSQNRFPTCSCEASLNSTGN